MSFYFQQIIAKPSRLDFDKKEITQLKKVLEESSLQHELEIEEFGVKTLSDITLKLKNINMPDNWLLWSPTNSTLHILHPSLSQECMQIECYLTIDDLCITRAFVHNTQILLSISKLVDVRQVFQLIEEVSKYSSDSVDLAVRSATTHLSYTINQIEENEEESSTVDLDLLPRLTFIHCQLENVLVPKTRRKYNVVTTILSLKCELISCCLYISSIA